MAPYGRNVAPVGTCQAWAQANEAGISYLKVWTRADPGYWRRAHPRFRLRFRSCATLNHVRPGPRLAQRRESWRQQPRLHRRSSARLPLRLPWRRELPQGRLRQIAAYSQTRVEHLMRRRRRDALPHRQAFFLLLLEARQLLHSNVSTSPASTDPEHTLPGGLRTRRPRGPLRDSSLLSLKTVLDVCKAMPFDRKIKPFSIQATVCCS